MSVCNMVAAVLEGAGRCDVYNLQPIEVYGESPITVKEESGRDVTYLGPGIVPVAWMRTLQYLGLNPPMR